MLGTDQDSLDPILPPNLTGLPPNFCPDLDSGEVGREGKWGEESEREGEEEQRRGRGRGRGEEEELRKGRGKGRGKCPLEGASLAHYKGPFLFPTCRRGSLSGLGPIVWGREPHWQGINL